MGLRIFHDRFKVESFVFFELKEGTTRTNYIITSSDKPPYEVYKNECPYAKNSRGPSEKDESAISK